MKEIKLTDVNDQEITIKRAENMPGFVVIEFDSHSRTVDAYDLKLAVTAVEKREWP